MEIDEKSAPGPRPAGPLGEADAPRPRRQLTVWHAASVCIGMVMGASIFQTPASAAANFGSAPELLLTWVAGGVLSIVGALCFAEMSAAFPDAGGDYFFLWNAFGRNVAFLFAWSRFAVIHTGSMALEAFVFGDYLAQILPLGAHGAAVCAALVIVVLVGINLAGIRFGIGTQITLMSVVIFGLLCIGAAGVWLTWFVPPLPAFAIPAGAAVPHSRFGAALVYVFLAYGGWSDAATLSAEMRDQRNGIKHALIFGMAGVMALYMLVNWAFLQGLGLAGLAGSDAPAAALMARAFGRPGQLLIIAVVSVTTVSVLNALLIAGARTTYAAARDTRALRRLGRWHAVRGTPSLAVVAIGAVSLLLVGLGSFTRSGFSTMVDFQAPVYWAFLTMSGISLLILRRRFPHVHRPYRVPLYPWLPLVFIASSLYVLYSSLAYVKLGAIAGLAVLLAGALLMIPLRSAERR